MTVKAQGPFVSQLAREVKEACQGQVEVTVQDLPFSRRIVVTLRPASPWRPWRDRGRAWKRRMLSKATVVCASAMPANVMTEVRWKR